MEELMLEFLEERKISLNIVKLGERERVRGNYWMRILGLGDFYLG